MVELLLLVFERLDLLIIFLKLPLELCPLLGGRFRFRHLNVLLVFMIGIKKAGAQNSGMVPTEKTADVFGQRPFVFSLFSFLSGSKPPPSGGG